MGGSCDPNDDDGTSYEVMTVNLRTGDLGEVKDTIYGTNAPAAASSLNRIALCGGKICERSLNHCQVYSPKQNRCACHMRINLFSKILLGDRLPDPVGNILEMVGASVVSINKPSRGNN